jgi:hypothetical protein
VKVVPGQQQAAAKGTDQVSLLHYVWYITFIHMHVGEACTQSKSSQQSKPSQQSRSNGQSKSVPYVGEACSSHISVSQQLHRAAHICTGCCVTQQSLTPPCQRVVHAPYAAVTGPGRQPQSRD